MTEQQRIARRAFLRGAAGVSLGLPMLESLQPLTAMAARSGKTVAGSPVRMACVFFPNGAIMPQWKPADGQELKLGKTMKPLEGMKDKFSVLSGLTLDNGRSKGDGAGDHARCGATYLTAARPVKSASNIRLGISVDQIAASDLQGQTRLPSIELGLEGSRNAGSCDSGYSCAYSSNISWRNETQPSAKETSPRAAFLRLFGASEQDEELQFYRKSILDVVQHDADRLIRNVGPTDRMKLDEYFTSVRELETRIERSEQETKAAMPDFDAPDGRPEHFREHARLMYDLIVLAFQNDATRVATLMLDNAGGNRVYKEAGVNEAHHQLSHHRNQEDKVENLRKIDYYLMEQFAYFLKRMDETKENGRSLLDQSMVLYGSGLSDGNRHQHEDLPLIMAGSAGGAFQTGRHIQFADETPMANLFMTMLDAMGTPVDSIGDSTGRLKQMLA